MRTTTSRIAALGVAALTAAALAFTGPVQASVDDQVVSANPVNYTPRVMDGAVYSIARVGQTMVAGGKFTTVTAAGSTVNISRKNLFAFDAATGDISTTFVPVLDGLVSRVVASGDGSTAYIAGEFKTIDGIKRSKVARIDVTTGALDPTFVPPAINGKVTDMVLRDGVLYISGAFTKVGPVVKSGVAALDPTTGKDTGRVSSTFASPFNGGAVGVKALDVSDDGSRLVAVGNFRTVDGQSRVQVVVLNTSVSPAVVSPWASTRFSGSCASVFDTYMRDVSIAPDGSWFAVATTGAYSGGATSGTMCDAVSRYELTPESADRQPTWVDYTGGDTLTAVEAFAKVLYVGGHQRWLNNPYAGDAAGPGAVSRPGIAAVDVRNGLPFSWNPTRARQVGLREFVSDGNGIWVAHDSNRLGREDRRRVGYFPLSGGTNLPTENTGSLPGTAVSLGLTSGNSDTVVQRSMTATAVSSSSTVDNGGQDWSSSRGAFMVDGTLYTGWSNGTLQARTYDGTTFGAARTVNLNGLTSFASDLQNVTGMFYERSHGRLYYTISGSSRLYYRYFLPESEIVGGVRFDAGGAVGNIDWSRAGGMFVAGGTLYVADRVDGSLSSAPWNGSTVTGNKTTISSPQLDGQDWRARGTFLLAL